MLKKEKHFYGRKNSKNKRIFQKSRNSKFSLRRNQKTNTVGNNKHTYCKSKDEDLLGGIDDKLNRWRDHLEEILSEQNYLLENPSIVVDNWIYQMKKNLN